MPYDSLKAYTIALQILKQAWPRLLAADVVYKALTFILIAPLVGFGLRQLLSSRGHSVLADQDILFFILTPVGLVTVTAIGVLTTTILVLEQACLMVIAFGESREVHVQVIDALIFAARKSWVVVQFSLAVVVRLLLIASPFVAVGVLIFTTLLNEHDINFYLAQRPPVFVFASGLILVLLTMGVVVSIRRLLNWAFALPLILFEELGPAQALKTSSLRTETHKVTIGLTLVSWGAGAALFSAAPLALVGAMARWTVPRFAGSMTLLVTVIGAFLLAWWILNLFVTLINESMLALLSVSLFDTVGGSSSVEFSGLSFTTHEPKRLRQRMSMKWAIVAVTATALLAAVIGQILVDRVRFEDDVIVIAHRGAAGDAPENTLAAVALAIEHGADMIEIDVQENADGEVVVIHDKDLMRVGKTPCNIWQTSNEDFAGIDVGSWFGSDFSDQRVPTLGQVLELCRGRARVDIELKYYGHNDRLEEKVAEIVEQTGMQDDIVVMSLERTLVSSMKSVRPQWKVGLLTAKAIGDLTRTEADFLAVHVGIVDGAFVRRAHAAGKEVYVWTVNDGLNMSRMMSTGVDGIITDYPSLARQVIERRAELSSAERLMLTAAYWMGIHPKEPPPERDAG